MSSLRNFVGGAWVPPRGGGWMDVVEPATGAVYARVADSGGADVDEAVRAAGEAFAGWAATPAAERSRVMLRVAALIEDNLEALARAESVDSGKPVALARRVDIPRAAANFRFFATAILHTRSDLHDTDGAALNYTLRRPLGVVGCISPWNLPLYLFTWKIAPAIAAGNCVVGKPSEVTPVTASMLCDLCNEAGLPPGVLNVVHGAGAGAGKALVEHAGVRAISFTGGTATGRAIAATAGPAFKKVSLELGGKNANVVFADADVEEAAREACRAAFTNQGQVCLCGSRVFVQRGVYDAFVDRLVAHARALRVGDPLDEQTEQGALVSRAHFEKVRDAVERAKKDGARALCGGAPADAPNARCAQGVFYPPTVLADAPASCEAMQEEIFGPVVTVTPFDTEEEALALANGVRYGLAAMVWTSDLNRAHRVAARLEAGIVWVNCWMVRDLRTPFGGMKESGVGREGGDEALRFFTEMKNVCLRMGGE
ncbi:MAG: aldehyde dehydrogenase [Phycisphaerales bacterium]|nr:MAG: aldehyde dehydrogenase [Phycisphaerales bacterium]